MNAKKVLIIGDSHAKGFLPHVRTDSDAIAERIGTPGYLRQAVSGSTAHQWAHDFDGRLTHAELCADDADAVLISLGGNDLFAALQDGKIEDHEIARFCVDLGFVVRTLARHDLRLFILLYGYPFDKTDAQKFMALHRLDAMIEAAAGESAALHGYGIEKIDERLVLQAEDWPGDDIHPWETGYQRIGDEILKRLAK